MESTGTDDLPDEFYFKNPTNFAEKVLTAGSTASAKTSIEKMNKYLDQKEMKEKRPFIEKVFTFATDNASRYDKTGGGKVNVAVLKLEMMVPIWNERKKWKK